LIGSGDVGIALTRGFLRDGYKVIMGTRKPNETKEKEMLENIIKSAFKDEVDGINKHRGDFSLVTQEDAANKGEIIILAVNWAAVEIVCNKLKSYVKEKIVIDVTNPLHYESGKYAGLLPLKDSKGNHRSGGEVVQELLSHSKVVKCFNMISTIFFTEGTRFFEMLPLMYVSGNDEDANNWTLELLKKWKFDGHVLGDIKTSHYSEVMCHLWLVHYSQTGFKGSKHAFALPRNW